MPKFIFYHQRFNYLLPYQVVDWTTPIRKAGTEKEAKEVIKDYENKQRNSKN